eukprot:5307141-Amphidinium_carterae.2
MTRRKKGDNTKGKDGRTVTCYTCGKQGHTSTLCYHNKGKSGKGQSKGPQSFYYSQRKDYPQSPAYQQEYYSQPSRPQYPTSTAPPPKGYTTKAMGNIGTKEARKVNQFQYIKSTTMRSTTLTTTGCPMLGTIPGVRNGIQMQMPINNGQVKKLDKFFSNSRLETIQTRHYPGVYPLSGVCMRSVP